MLGCIVLGEENAFPVDFNTEKTIGHLKGAIKEQAGLAEPAHKLILWKVNIPESKKREIYEGIDIKERFGGEKLDSDLKTIGKVFDQPLSEHIHIIVQPPLPATTGATVESSIPMKRPGEFQDSNREPVAPLEEDFWNELSKAQIVFKLPEDADETVYKSQLLSKYMEVEGNKIVLSENIMINSQDELIFNDGNHVLIGEQKTKITISYAKFLRLRKSPDGIVSGIRTQDMLIKKSYLEMIEKIEYDRIHHYKEGCTIVGSPGIGKTHFSLYIAFYITRRYPSASITYHYPVEDEKTYTLHIDQGNKSVIGFPQGLKGKFLPDSFYIADSVFPNTVCKMKYRFLVTTPKNVRWHEFEKEFPRMYYAPIWTEEEIWDVWNWNDKYKAKIPMSRVEDLIKKWGCIPRRVFDEYDDEPDIKKLVSFCDVYEFLKNDGESLNDKYSGKVIHIIPGLDFRSKTYVPASAEICEALYQHYEERTKDTIISVIRNFAGGCGGTFAGNFFEMLAHDVLRKGGKFKTRRVTDDGRSWPEEVLDFQGLEPNRYDNVQEINSEYYNYPKIRNFESVDAIAPQRNGSHHLYQITIAGKHDVKVNGLEKLKDHIGGNLPIDLYFVVPSINSIFTNFRFQNYVTAKGEKYKRWNATNGWILGIRQYILEIKLKEPNKC